VGFTFRTGASLAFEAIEIVVLDHVYELAVGAQDGCAAQGLEPKHRPRDLFDYSRAATMPAEIREDFCVTQIGVDDAATLQLMQSLGSKPIREAGFRHYVHRD